MVDEVGILTTLPDAADAARARERLERTLDASRTGTWEWDPSTDAVEWSSALNALHGVPAGGAPRDLAAFLALVHEDDRALVEDSYRRAMSEGWDVDVEFRAVAPDGGVRWIASFGRAYEDGPGTPPRVVGISRDITHRKNNELQIRQQAAALAEAHDQLDAILAGLAAGVTAQGPDGRLVYANDAAAALIGFDTADELVRASPRDVTDRFEMMTEDGDAFPIERLPGRRALAGEATPEELVRFCVKATGQERWALVKSRPIRDARGGVRLAINIFEDLTEQKLAEQRQRFLAQASALMVTTLDYEQTLGNVARLAVPTLGDACSIDLLDEDGRLQRLHVAHRDPGKEALTRELATRYPASEGHRSAISTVVRTGQSLLVEEVSDEQVAESAPEPDRLRLLRAIGVRSAMIVPLRARGRTHGAISFAVTESARQYGPGDLALAEDLAGRAAMAVDNARLYRDLGLVAAREQTRAAELQAVIGAMGDAVIVADGIGRVVLSNPAAQELLPEPALEDLPALLDALVGDDGRRPRLVSLERDGARELQLRESGQWLSVAAYGVPGQSLASAAGTDGQQVRSESTSARASTILIVRDVTAERQARHLQETFVGVLSHELRTPITTIYGGSRMLQRERSGLTDEMRRELLADISVEADRLHRLTEDLLVLTRLERGGVVIASEPILLQRVIPEVVRAESGRSPDHTFALEIAPGLPPVRGELTYVEQVVRNLVSNAAKYSPPGSTVLITALDTGDEIEVRVCDEGSGIDPAETEQLFELLYRSEAVVREVSGAGIGLFVCRSLLHAMGGHVWAYNRPSGGAAFAFRLPIYAEG